VSVSFCALPAANPGLELQFELPPFIVLVGGCA